MPRIGIIGLSSLETIGIKTIIEEVPESISENVEISIYEKFNELNQDVEKLDSYIIGMHIFAAHIDFFLPRKSKVLLLNRDNYEEEFEANNNNSGIRQIYRYTSGREISDIIRNLLVEISDKEEMTGELSIREKDVLKELAQGKTNKEIADILSISVNTVITHRKNISSKLGIKSVSGLSLYALMNGII